MRGDALEPCILNGVERMVLYHSTYKGWDIVREWNAREGHGMMSYWALKDGDELHARNLSGIKRAVTQAVGQ